MKKLIFILSLVILCVTASIEANAQAISTSMPKGATYVELTGTATLNQNYFYADTATAAYWYISAPQDWYTAQTVVLKLDSIKGNQTNVAVQLYGRVNTNTAWATIGSVVNWKGTTADTTITYTNATENLYRQFKVNVVGTGNGRTKVSKLAFKQYFGLP